MATMADRLTDIFVARSQHNVLVDPEYVPSREIVGPTASDQIPDGRPLRIRIVFETPGPVAGVESHLLNTSQCFFEKKIE